VVTEEQLEEKFMIEALWDIDDQFTDDDNLSDISLEEGEIRDESYTGASDEIQDILFHEAFDFHLFLLLIHPLQTHLLLRSQVLILLKLLRLLLRYLLQRNPKTTVHFLEWSLEVRGIGRECRMLMRMVLAILFLGSFM
jgi:hypothetical protein